MARKYSKRFYQEAGARGGKAGAGRPKRWVDRPRCAECGRMVKRGVPCARCVLTGKDHA